MMPTPALTVGGTPLYPQGGLLDQSRPVYRPEYGNAGLLNQPDMNNLVSKFAGGLLNGYQVGSTPDANGRYFTPVAPSGVYTTNPGSATTVTDNRSTPGGGLSFRDYIAARFGPGNLYGGEQDVFLGHLMTNDSFRKKVEKQWGANLDDAYDPSSDFWKTLTSHLGKIGGNVWQGGPDGTGGGGAGPGASGGGSGMGADPDGGAAY